MNFFLLVILWSSPPAVGQRQAVGGLPELAPETRFRTAVESWLHGDDGVAITHLLLLSGRHPSHPLAPWARLGAAALYEKKGDFIAAIVQYRKTEPLFAPPAGDRLREHRERLELELARLPVQIMRLGRHLLATAAPTEDWIRLAQWFAVRFRPNPLSARLKLQIAAFRLQQGRRFEAIAHVLWAARDPGPGSRRTAAGVLHAWQPAVPSWTGCLWLPLILAGVWSLIRLWQLGPVGPAHWVAVAAIGGGLSLLLPRSFSFFPFFFFLAGLSLWCYGFPRRMSPQTAASLAIILVWFSACSLIIAGRFPL